MQVSKIKAFALVVPKNKEVLKKKLTIISKGKNPFSINLFFETSEGFWIPRVLVSNSKVPVEESKTWYLDKEIKSNIQLKPEQLEIKKQFLDAIKDYSPYGGIIEAKTGFGKTYLALDLVATLGGRTLIVVPTTYLMRQWIERIQKHFSIKPENIGIIQQNKCIVDKPIVVAMLHSISMKEYPNYVYSMFHNVVVDEIHRIATQVFSNMAKKFHSKYNIGLSATPRRKDGTENVFKYCIGSVVAQSTKLVNKPKVLIVNYFGVDTDHRGCVYKGELSLGKYLNRLEKSKMRNDNIATILHSLYLKGKKILLLSDRLKLLDNLKILLLKKGVPENKIGFLTGSTKKVDRQIILGTYGSAGLGADIPQLDVLVFATPRTDIEQPFGRITRVADACPLVIDIVDYSSSIMRKWAMKRRNFYNKFAQGVVNYDFRR